MSTEKDREAALKHLDTRYPAKDFANPYNYTMVIAEHSTSFLAGIQHARQGERERLIGFCERLLARHYIDIVDEVWTRDALKLEIDEFLEQEAKRDE